MDQRRSRRVRVRAITGACAILSVSGTRIGAHLATTTTGRRGLLSSLMDLQLPPPYAPGPRACTRRISFDFRAPAIFGHFWLLPLLACRRARRGAPSVRLLGSSVAAQWLPAGFRTGVPSTGPARPMLGAAVAPLHDVYIAHPLPRHRLTGACRPSHRLDRSLDPSPGGRQRSTTCLRVTAAGRPGLCAHQLAWYVACGESGPAGRPSASGATVNSRLDRGSPPEPSSKPFAAQTALQQQRGRIARRLRLPENRLAVRCDMAWD